MNIQERMKALRQQMYKKNIDVYLVPSADNHQSEYVGEYFKSRAFITGFTGSAGTAVITMDKAGLWTDGRYLFRQKKNFPEVVLNCLRWAIPVFRLWRNS